VTYKIKVNTQGCLLLRWEQAVEVLHSGDSVGSSHRHKTYTQHDATWSDSTLQRSIFPDNTGRTRSSVSESASIFNDLGITYQSLYSRSFNPATDESVGS
jgi:hypothetical protein